MKNDKHIAFTELRFQRFSGISVQKPISCYVGIRILSSWDICP